MIAKCVQNPEINLIGTMCIRGMSFRFDIRSIVVEQVENIVAFMLVSPNNLGINRYMISYQCVSTYAFLKTKIFG